MYKLSAGFGQLQGHTAEEEVVSCHDMWRAYHIHTNSSHLEREQRVKRVIEQEEKERLDQSRSLAEEKLGPSRHVHSAPTAQPEAKSDHTPSSSSSPPSRTTPSTIPVFQQDDSDSHSEASKHNFTFTDGTIDPSQIGRRPSHDGVGNPWGLDYDKTTIFGLQPPARSVPYTNYYFVDPGYLNQLSHIDVKYLTEKGCLSLPSDTLLEEFFHQYFSHIHPIIPLLSEAEFWAAEARIPLLLIRAILFIASPVSPSSASILVIHD